MKVEKSKVDEGRKCPDCNYTARAYSPHDIDTPRNSEWSTQLTWPNLHLKSFHYPLRDSSHENKTDLTNRPHFTYDL